MTVSSPSEDIRGADVIVSLARIYPQLYLVPGPDGSEEYKRIVECGEIPKHVSRPHFKCCPEDSLITEMTPAGPVPVITLSERADFELFLQIMAHRCVPKEIPVTQGASILDGVINWTKIRAHEKEFILKNGPDADWNAEFDRFTSDRKNFKDALVILSRGPYSAVSAEKAGFSEAEWLELSHIIRKTHECTHFICRRLFPDKKDPVWDELVADAAGLFAAFGRFDLQLAELFLGISGEKYIGGRLENYIDGEENRQERLDSLASEIHRTLLRFSEISEQCDPADPYGFALRLEEEIGCWKKA
ncbi:MAG: hypothetical protein IJH53_06765 [Oscillospiraceae bacterium]|nr:hypothetical protein [Oscillospiraceae bacterium]